MTDLVTTMRVTGANCTMDNVTTCHRREPYIVWSLWVREVITPMLVLIGLLGNTMSFWVMRSRPLRHKSYSCYLCTLAVFDTLTLIHRQVLAVDELRAARRQPSLFDGFSDASCKAVMFSEHVCFLMSSWLVVLMACERLVAIYRPLRKGTFCTKARAIVAIVGLFLAICCTQVTELVMVGYSKNRCLAKEEYRKLYTKLITYFLQVCLILLLPMPAIIFSNLMVLLKICRYRRMVSFQNRLEGGTSQVISRKRFKTTLMLMTISFIHVITLLPLVLSSLFVQISIETQPRSVSARIFFAFIPYRHLLETLSTVNYSANFFVYVWSGKAFRQELRKAFSCGKDRRALKSGGTTKSTKEDILLTQLDGTAHTHV